jgi:hypothetical protein
VVSTPVRPADRYGDRQWSRRWQITFGVLAVVVIGVALVVMMRIADSGVSSSLVSWQNPEDDVMVTTIAVTRPAGTAVTCELAARDIRQIIVGQATVEIPAGPDRRIELDVDIPLQGDGVAPEIQNCQVAE